MQLPPFALEEFWRQYEFSAPYILCSSVTQTWTMQELVEMQDAQTRQLWQSLDLGYTETPGHPLLCEQISHLYPGLNQEHILTCAGAQEGIYCTLQTLVKPGDHVLIAGPCYESLQTIPSILGAHITQVPLVKENGWTLTSQDFAHAFRDNTKLVILNDPHSPTGSLLSARVMDDLIEQARACQAWIFCDEVYRDLELDPQDQLPSIATRYEKGISLQVLSKSFGLPGLRIGWIACPDTHILDQICSYKQYTSICNSAPSEILALTALRSKDSILQRNRQIMLQSFAALERFLDRHPSLFSWIKPKSGPTAMVEWLGPEPVDTFTKKLVDQTGILLMPSTVYGFEGNGFRIGFGKRNTEELLERLEHALEVLV